MKVRLVSSSHFSAAHRLHRDDWDEEKNRRIFDKCNNPHGHGHTYGLEVTVEGEIDPETGYVMDFVAGINPTAENIAAGIWRRLEGRVAPARLVRIALDETEKNRVVYEGGER